VFAGRGGEDNPGKAGWVIEDQQSWIRTEVRSICEYLGIDEPLIVFDAQCFKSYRYPVSLKEFEIVGNRLVRMDRPELWVPPEALTDQTSGELRYRIARVLLSQKVVPTLYGISIGYLVWACFAIALGAFCMFLGLAYREAFFIAASTGIPCLIVTYHSYRRRASALDEQAISITGETEGAVAALHRDSSLECRELSHRTMAGVRRRADRHIRRLKNVQRQGLEDQIDDLG
jgi:hypothetical protein